MKFHDYEIAKNLANFDENIFIEELMNSVDTFSEQIQLMINEALKYAVNKTDFFHIYEWLQDPIKWRMPKVSVDTFLSHPHYLWSKTDNWNSVFKMVRQICRDVIEWGYSEAIELAWIGCERLWTKIIMADWTIKPNTEIQVWDFLMWIDWKPRKILQKHSWIDDMYEIIPYKWDSKFVTKEHRLHWIWTSRGKIYSGSRKYIWIDKRWNTTQNIAVKDFLNLSEKNKKLFKLLNSTWIDFPEKEVKIPPYLLWLWLWDWTNCRTEITNIDWEVIEYIKDYATSKWAKITKNKDAYKITYWNIWNKQLSYVNEYFAQYNLINNKHIPDNFLYNSRENRLELLAWLIDTDWSNAWNYFEFYQKDEKLIDQVSYLARSLWFKVIKKKNDKILNWRLFKNFKISICWDCSIIPTKIKRKQCGIRLQKKDILRTWIKEIKYVWKEEYIWFKIDWDELYMWDDFMITHNSWKSFSSQVMICYQAHHLLCLRTPHKNYWLTADKPLTIMNMWTTSTQALEVVFAWVKSFIEASPFFQQFNPNMQQTTIRFWKEWILLMSWNSKVTTSIWYNIFAAVLDEAAFYLDNDEKNIAEEIYNSLKKRITSRLWGKWGLLMGISSPRYEWDFITELIKQANQTTTWGKKKFKNIYWIQLPTWKVKEVTEDDLKQPFYFDVRKSMIIENANPDKLKAEWYNINFIKDWPITPDNDIWEIPEYFITHFQQNPEQAKRDYWATPSAVIAGYFSNPEKITNMFNKERINPVIWPWRYKFELRPLRVPYFVHIDIWFNRDWKWDHTWFCLWHFGGWEVDLISKEYRMRFVIDLTERIWITEDTGEVDLSEVRQRLYDLKDMWYFIKLVTFDQHASKDFRQIIEKKGFRTDYVSVDRDTWPYDILKAAIYEWRIDIPYDEVLERELKQLELVKGNKVDHPPSGCFTWDTRILLDDWSTISFEEAFEKYWKWEFKVFWSINWWACLTTARNCRITKTVKELIKLTLNNQETIECTLDHRFLLSDWSYKEAQYLTKRDCIESIKEPCQIVIKKDIIKKECQVWDIETNTSNFALANWVFVHNSKDVADSLAWVIWNISQNTPRSSITMRNLPENEQNSEINKYRQLKAQEEHYMRLQKQANKQQEMYQKIEEMMNKINDRKQLPNNLFKNV